MVYSNGVHFLYGLYFICTCSGLGMHRETVTAVLHKPIELHVAVNHTVCNYVVEWSRLNTNKTNTLCFRYTSDKSSCVGSCCKRAQFHCHNNSLVLNTVIPEYEGMYEEKIIYTDGTFKKINFTLKTFLSSLITNVSIISTPPTLIITCKVSGGNVSSKWLKDGETLLSRNLTLIVYEPTWRDCGNYTCLAESEGLSSEAHVNINGDYAICRKDLGRGAHGNDLTIKIVPAVILVLGLCIAAICIKKGHAGICCSKSETTNNRGTRGSNNAVTEAQHVYDEPRNIRENLPPNSSDVIQLPYVYTDFIPVERCKNHKEKARTEDASGYSTIGEVLQQAQAL